LWLQTSPIVETTDSGIMPTILIVDDTSEHLMVLRSALVDEYRVIVATDGPLALELAAKSTSPDLILLDVMMPGMDGYEVCRRLKANASTEPIPVIFVTALDDEVDELTGFDLGAVDYITKPISPPIVRKRVSTQLRLRNMQRDLETQNLALQEAARLRDDVERMTHHDLKTPLNAIIGLPQVLTQRRSCGEEEIQMLRAIEQSGLRMLDLINRSLDIYKMEVGSYRLSAQPMDLAPILRASLAETSITDAAFQKHWTLSRHGAPLADDDQVWATVEEMLCIPMFNNLLQNAFEASPRGAGVEVDIAEGEAGVEIRITNQGAIPESIRERFFEKYVTVGKPHGTGLGTYSAWLCARTQQGSIRVESLEHNRTQVTVVLPAPQSVSPEDLRPIFPSTQLKPKALTGPGSS